MGPQGPDISNMKPAERARVVNTVLDNVAAAIKRRRSVFGVSVSSVLDAFAAFDKQGRGSLGRKEFMAAMTRLGVSIVPKQAQCVLVELDTDGSGRIEYTEFASALTQRQGQLELERRAHALQKQGHGSRSHSPGDDMDAEERDKLHREGLINRASTRIDKGLVQQALSQFQDADQNDDGQISFPEFAQRMQMPPTSIAVRKLFDQFDVDGSGQITVGEFLKGLRKHHASWKSQ